MDRTVTAVIAEDEAPARIRLQELLAEVSWIDVVATCKDGPATIEAVDRLEPDVLFLDLHLPGCDGLRVLRQVTHKPAVIFTTAFDRYAVTAFELGAVDYLLKPFGSERLDAALQRLRETLGRQSDVPVTERAVEVLGPAERLSRLFIRTRTRILILPVPQIHRFEARNDYTAVHAGGQRYLVHLRLGDLERRLDPSVFTRIHRSHIVNLDQVEAFIPRPDSRLEVLLRDGTRILASRARSRVLRSQTV
jgi:two-component system LytT family response regulator